MLFPIRFKLLAIITVILVPLVAVSVHHYFEMVESNKLAIAAQNKAAAEEIAAHLDSVIERSFAALQALSRHPAVVQKDRSACDRLFAELLPKFPLHLNILAVDMEGHEYGSAVQTPKSSGLSVSDVTWFRKARRGVPVIGNRHISRLFQVPSVMIAIPVMDGRRQVGVLGMALDLVKVQSSLELTRHLPLSSTSNIIDSAGAVIVCVCEGSLAPQNGDQCQTALLDGGEGLAGPQGMGSDGIERLYSTAQVPGTDWKTVIGVPVSVAYTTAAEAARGFLIVMITAGLAGLGLSLLLSGTISRKVSALISAMREVESGNLAVRMPVSGDDELAAVAESFNRMAHQRREADGAFRRSTSFLTSVLEGIGEGVVVIDRDFQILSANTGYCRQLKLDHASVIGGRCYKLSHHRDTPCPPDGEGGCECAVRKCFETGAEHRAMHRHVDGEGKPIFIETRAYPLRDESGAVTAAIETLTDITERRQLEVQLFHSQKMEAVGMLAGGVAHDFNNILTAIIGYAELLRMSMQPGDGLREHVNEIQSSAERAAGLTKSLLAFSRKQVLEPAPLRLSEGISGIGMILRRTIGEDVELRFDLAPDELPVLADATQLDQVLMNLCTNARDAMPDGGRMVIATKLVTFGADTARPHPAIKDGAYMLLSVTDSGSGMDEATKEKIFEPFFTTKDLGRGTGLGLSITYGIVKQHQGVIRVDSAPGRGTTFEVYLPACMSEGWAEASRDVRIVTGGSEVILLAEDDATLLSLTERLLRSQGYKVIQACDGVEAVEKFREHADVVDLIILDVLMPRMNGREAFEEIRQHRKDIRTLFMSGYTSDVIRTKGIEENDFNFITKPFSPVMLLRKVRETISGGAA